MDMLLWRQIIPASGKKFIDWSAIAIKGELEWVVLKHTGLCYIDPMYKEARQALTWEQVYNHIVSEALRLMDAKQAETECKYDWRDQPPLTLKEVRAIRKALKKFAKYLGLSPSTTMGEVKALISKIRG